MVKEQRRGQHPFTATAPNSSEKGRRPHSLCPGTRRPGRVESRFEGVLRRTMGSLACVGWLADDPPPGDRYDEDENPDARQDPSRPPAVDFDGEVQRYRREAHQGARQGRVEPQREATPPLDRVC